MSRQREFDEVEALDAAMRVFWTHGYEGSSLSDLTAAMGISRPSLYAAFGNKDALYEKALERYVGSAKNPVTLALAEPTAERVVASLLQYYAAAPGDRSRPRGCMLVNGALRCGTENEAAEQLTRQYRDGSRLALQRRFEVASKAGERLPGAPAELARWVWTLLHGMSVDAGDGATTAELGKVARRALAEWKNGLPA
jgi:AcrR family transcriptional regulator